MKKILILGAGEGQVSLIRRANENGFITLVASPAGDYPGFAFASECCHVDIASQGSVLEIAIDKQIDAIATDQTDISVSTVDYVAKRLGLPHIECQNIDYFRYKYLMREICQSSGLPTIPYCVVSDPEEAKSFYLSLSVPSVIVKPVDSQGSRGVFRVDNEMELTQAVLKSLGYSKQRKVIIEQFVSGRELEVDCVVKNGSVVFSLVGDVHNFKNENAFSAFERIYPTELPEPVKKKVTSVNETTVLTLGLTKGWTHGEYMLADDGEVYLIEVGARGGGNYIGSDIVRAFCGYGTDEMALMTSIGDESFYDRLQNRSVFCAYKCFYLPEGVVVSIEIDWAFLNQPIVLRHNLDGLFVGKRVHKNADKTSRYTVVVQTSSRKELRAVLDRISNRIHVAVMTESGLKEAIWR